MTQPEAAARGRVPFETLSPPAPATSVRAVLLGVDMAGVATAVALTTVSVVGTSGPLSRSGAFAMALGAALLVAVSSQGLYRPGVCAVHANEVVRLGRAAVVTGAGGIVLASELGVGFGPAAVVSEMAIAFLLLVLGRGASRSWIPAERRERRVAASVPACAAIESAGRAVTRTRGRSAGLRATMAVPAVDAAVLTVAAVGVGLQPAALLFAATSWSLLALLAPTRHRIVPRVSDHAGVLAGSVAGPMLIAGPMIAGDPGAPHLLSAMPLIAGAVVAGRMASYAMLRRARSRTAEVTLLVGAGRAGTHLAGLLTQHPEFGLAPIGFVDHPAEGELPLPWLGDLSRMRELIHSCGVRRVVVTVGFAAEDAVVEAVRECLGMDVEIYVASPLSKLGGRCSRPDVEHLWGVPLMRLRRAALRAPSWQAKRALDAVGAGVGVLLTAPLLIAIAAAVKLTSRGPILFRQTRLGLRGRPIELLKFRSMFVNGDSDTRWSVAHDHRVTRVGRILRATSLDELPQLFNVLRGDISLVGPRPERPFFAEGFSTAVPGYGQRLRVPVGMTGWAQIHGLRGDTSIEERADFDNAYIDGWSLSQDLLILVRTIGPVLRDAAAALSGSRRRAATASSTAVELAPEGAEIDLRTVAEIDLTGVDEIDLRDPPAPAPPEPVLRPVTAHHEWADGGGEALAALFGGADRRVWLAATGTEGLTDPQIIGPRLRDEPGRSIGPAT